MPDEAQGVVYSNVLCPLVTILVVYIACIVWVSIDADRRGKNGCLVGLLVALLGPLGLLFWLVVRPERRRF